MVLYNVLLSKNNKSYSNRIRLQEYNNKIPLVIFSESILLLNIMSCWSFVKSRLIYLHYCNNIEERVVWKFACHILCQIAASTIALFSHIYTVKPNTPDITCEAPCSPYWFSLQWLLSSDMHQGRMSVYHRLQVVLNVLHHRLAVIWKKPCLRDLCLLRKNAGPPFLGLRNLLDHLLLERCRRK